MAVGAAAALVAAHTEPVERIEVAQSMIAEEHTALAAAAHRLAVQRTQPAGAARTLLGVPHMSQAAAVVAPYTLWEEQHTAQPAARTRIEVAHRQPEGQHTQVARRQPEGLHMSQAELRTPVKTREMHTPEVPHM